MRMRLEHLKKHPEKQARFAGTTVRIWSGEHNAWWRTEGRGYCDETRGAGLYSFEDAWEHIKTCGPEKKIVIFLARVQPVNVHARITKETTTVYRAAGRRFFTPARAYDALARQFIRQSCECSGGKCWYHAQSAEDPYHNLKFATRSLIAIFRRAEREGEGWDDAAVCAAWDEIYEGERARQLGIPRPTEMTAEELADIAF